MTPAKAQAARRAWVLHLGRCRQCRNPGPSLCWRGKLMAVRVLEGMTDGESLYVKVRARCASRRSRTNPGTAQAMAEQWG